MNGSRCTHGDVCPSKATGRPVPFTEDLHDLESETAECRSHRTVRQEDNRRAPATRIGGRALERPGAVGIEKLGGRPAGSGEGVDDGAAMATTSAPPNWDDVLGDGGRAADAGAHRPSPAPPRRRRARQTHGLDGG